MRRLAILLVGVAAGLQAQRVTVYSEFQRIDPFGNVVAADRADPPREILSPAVVPNGFATFQVAVSVPAGQNYFLYVAMNPADSCQATLYRERFIKTKDGWVPDTLDAVRNNPDFGVIPDPDQPIPGQTTRVYLLDVWIPPDTPAGRFRLEVQLRLGYWIIYPMEVRVIPAHIPDLTSAGFKNMPAIEEAADASAAGPLETYMAGKSGWHIAGLKTVRDAIRRNANQDMALAATLDPARAGPKSLAARWKELSAMSALGAERYLRIRDFIYAEAGREPSPPAEGPVPAH